MSATPVSLASTLERWCLSCESYVGHEGQRDDMHATTLFLNDWNQALATVVHSFEESILLHEPFLSISSLIASAKARSESSNTATPFNRSNASDTSKSSIIFDIKLQILTSKNSCLLRSRTVLYARDVESTQNPPLFQVKNLP